MSEATTDQVLQHGLEIQFPYGIGSTQPTAGGGCLWRGIRVPALGWHDFIAALEVSLALVVREIALAK